MKICFHRYEDVKFQMTKGVLFHYVPGYRLVQKCKKCGKIKYVNLNLAMPDKYLYRESIWIDE